MTPKTILRDVRKLPPAGCLTWRSGRSTAARYWNLAAVVSQEPVDLTFQQAADRLAGELTRAVDGQRVSDVPLGAFLSGGLDSTAITHRLAAHASGPVHTFSIGFREKTYSELPYARLAAASLGTDHHEEVIAPNLDDLLPKLAWYLDEPFADTAAVPMFMLSALARRHVTVALSGEGGDECFAGYDTYLADRLARTYRRLPPFARRLLRSAASGLPSTRRKVSIDYKAKQFTAYAGESPERAHYSWRLLFDEPEKAQLLGGDVMRALAGYCPFEGFLERYRETANAAPLHQAMYVDMQTWLADAMFVKVDRTSMAHGLEARVPMVDRRLVEFAFSLPPSFKLRGLSTKRVLRHAVRNDIPGSIVRRKKRGFNAPVAHWIVSMQPARNHRDEVMSGFDRTWRSLVDAHGARQRDNGFRLWTLSQWTFWCQAVRRSRPVQA